MDISEYKKLLDCSDENSSWVNIDWVAPHLRVRRVVNKMLRRLNRKSKNYFRKKK